MLLAPPGSPSLAQERSPGMTARLLRTLSEPAAARRFDLNRVAGAHFDFVTAFQRNGRAIRADDPRGPFGTVFAAFQAERRGLAAGGEQGDSHVGVEADAAHRA